MGLREYRAKRDFTRTEEPAGGSAARLKRKEPFFVIQKHAARRLHYDFRLEMDGVLKSWAVPKGLPLRKGEKHLAVQVEDHPIDYANFEGIIPPGNYGAGTVMVWDRGSYEVLGENPTRALEAGKIHLQLKGEKLDGEWTLVRLRSRGDDEKQNWLILKTGADAQPISSRIESRSVLTQRALEEIAADESVQWRSNRPSSTKADDRSVKGTSRAQRAASLPASRISNPGPRRSTRQTKVFGDAGNGSTSLIPSSELKKLPRKGAAFIPPMQCLLVDDLPQGPQWLYEIKFDGYRAETIQAGRKISLISRNQKEFTAAYPSITNALTHLSSRSAVLDGEIVALDAEGKPSFQLLQSYDPAQRIKPPIHYYVFDLMNLDGHDLTELPLVRRKEILEQLLRPLPDTVLFSASIAAEPARLIREMKARGLEGLVAKDRDSTYQSGRRTGAWSKFKWTNEQEFVIGGYTRPQGTRSHFGAILVGFYEKQQLIFASKVGTGFDTKTLRLLHTKFQPLIRTDCPFVNLPEKRQGRWGQGITHSQMKLCTWLEPRLVCQIRFTEWTRDGNLRHPVFVGLREDKDPKEVVREEPA